MVVKFLAALQTRESERWFNDAYGDLEMYVLLNEMADAFQLLAACNRSFLIALEGLLQENQYTTLQIQDREKRRHITKLFFDVLIANFLAF